ncbi:MAG: HlyD family secretion protein [Anaerolineae bacterium]
MHKKRTQRGTHKRRLGAGLTLLFLLALFAVRVDAGGWRARRSVASPALEASGVITVREIAVAGTLSGRIAEVPVQEGARVQAGDVLAQLDTALIDADLEAARAQLAIAEAGLAQARAGASPTQLTLAEAQLAQAQAGYRAAQQAVTDTQTLLVNPQEINLQIAVTQAHIETARHEVEQAVAMKDGAEFAKNQAAALVERFGGDKKERVEVGRGDVEDILDELPSEVIDNLPDLPDDLPTPEGVYTWKDWELHLEDGSYQLFKWVGYNVPMEAYLAPHYWWQAWIGVNSATIRLEDLEAQLAELYTQRASPPTLRAQAEEAQQKQAEARAQVKMAQAQVEGLRAGATKEELAVVASQVAQARAAVEALEEKRAMMTLTAPLPGTVLNIVLQPGEVAAQGATVLLLGDLTEVTLELYIPQTELGRVYLGQPVQVTVDSFPERSFEGRVDYIADQAEFTPRNITTREERTNLVFAVRVTIPNPDGALKPGMPADAVFVDSDAPGRKP